VRDDIHRCGGDRERAGGLLGLLALVDGSGSDLGDDRVAAGLDGRRREQGDGDIDDLVRLDGRRRRLEASVVAEVARNGENDRTGVAIVVVQTHGRRRRHVRQQLDVLGHELRCHWHAQKVVRGWGS
jgi:hypothetical protein